jgi:hypothetical protein
MVLKMPYNTRILEVTNSSTLTLNFVLIFCGVALDYGVDNREFACRQGLGIFPFTTASRPLWDPPSPVALSLGVKQPGCEDDHSPPSSADVKQ